MSRYTGPNPDQSRRRVTKDQLDASRAAWSAGEFSDEWIPWRALAAKAAGIIDPPEGTRWDQWDDEQPSERALLIRAIRETPMTLRAALTSGKCFTWAQVVRVVLQRRDAFAEAIDRRELDDADRRRDEPTRAEAAESLRSILSRVLP